MTGNDEISDLIRVYNEMGEVLRSHRTEAVQRELLLDTILQGTPAAIILLNSADRIVYANFAARDLAGERLEGRTFSEIAERLPAPMRDAVAAGRDVLFTVPTTDRDETFHLTRRAFRLNTQRHSLIMFERLTPELRRQEVAVWKKAIRTMSHELNNSLAPISSLMHSMRHVADKPEHAHHLEEIYSTIEERLRHLRQFLEGYAEFARLPAPRREPVSWNELLEEVRHLYPFELRAPAGAHGCVDRAQMQQALINLLKNAHESGSAPDEIAVEVAQVSGGTSPRPGPRPRNGRSGAAPGHRPVLLHQARRHRPRPRGVQRHHRRAWRTAVAACARRRRNDGHDVGAGVSLKSPNVFHLPALSFCSRMPFPGLRLR